MKTFLRIIAVIVMAGSILSMKSDKVTRVVFFGDSITQMGADPGGYIDLLGAKLKAEGLGDKFNLTGAGIGGNKVYDLYLRLDKDVIEKNPDIVVIWIGVNDVWHKSTLGTGTDPDKFEKFYQAIISKLKSLNIKLILCTPSTIGEKTDCTNQQDGDLNRYAQMIRDLAERNNCKLCDFRNLFLHYNLEHNTTNAASGILTTDGVHLNHDGNNLVAGEFFRLLTE